MTEEPAEVSVDAFLGGVITIMQGRKGHRVGLDAALLQALVPADATGTAIDLGTGVGTVAFAAAARAPSLRSVGIDRDTAALDRAAAALRLPENSGFADRVGLVRAEIGRESLTGGTGLDAGSADWVLMNPPYDQPGRVRASPDEARQGAHIGESDTLEAWTRAAAGLLRPRGHLGIIHRTFALPGILVALARGFGDVRVLPVHPRRDALASRVLVRATRASRAPMQISPGLVLHEADGSWTREADAILSGTAALSV